ncbi:MAG: hypothetical protein WBW53_01355 [Terriglobales bacterium]
MSNLKDRLEEFKKTFESGAPPTMQRLKPAMSSCETPYTTVPILAHTQAPAHIAQSSCVV